MTTLDENMRVEHFTSTPPEKRVAAHSHIRGLGLSADGTAHAFKGGFVGQENAREVSKKQERKDKEINKRIKRQVVLWLT